MWPRGKARQQHTEALKRTNAGKQGLLFGSEYMGWNRSRYSKPNCELSGENEWRGQSQHDRKFD